MRPPWSQAHGQESQKQGLGREQGAVAGQQVALALVLGAHAEDHRRYSGRGTQAADSMNSGGSSPFRMRVAQCIDLRGPRSLQGKLSHLACTQRQCPLSLPAPGAGVSHPALPFITLVHGGFSHLAPPLAVAGSAFPWKSQQNLAPHKF